jgi:hypothetical protein
LITDKSKEGPPSAHHTSLGYLLGSGGQLGWF